MSDRNPNIVADEISNHLSRIDAVSDVLCTLGCHELTEEVASTSIAVLMADASNSVDRLRELTDELSEEHSKSTEN